MPLTEKQKNNYAYYQLVDGENDLIGMIGYSLYKKAKIDYIEKYYTENSEYPDNELLKEFQFQQCGQTNVLSHRNYAEQLMNSFISEYIQEHAKELNDKTLEVEEKFEEIKRKNGELEKREKDLKRKEQKFKQQKKVFD